MTSIIVSIVASLLKLFLERSAASAQTKAAYEQFRKSLDDDADSSSKIRRDAMKQKEEIFRQIDEENQKEKST